MSVIDPPVDAAAGAGGMEYPTLVTTAGDTVFARPGIRLPEYVTVHEVGHNWFQGMLASNEAEEAWLDEGVNEWADAHGDGRAVRRARRGDRLDGLAGRASRAASARSPTIRRRSRRRSRPRRTRSSTTSAYGEATYIDDRCARCARSSCTVGSAKFAAAMKAYAQAWAFKHPTGRDLFATLERELGEDLTWFFGPVFHEVGALAARRCATPTCRPRTSRAA